MIPAMSAADENSGPSVLAAPASQRPREARRAVLWPAGLKIVGKPEIRCVVIDLSSGGAKVRVDKPVAEGTLVKLRSQRFTRDARVVWSTDGLVGLQFVESNEHLMKTLDGPG